MRATDQIARYCGEEIVILLPATSQVQAEPVPDHVRRQIMGMIVPELAGRWVVTASIGATGMLVEDSSIAVMLARADAALFGAKENGRNRLEISAVAELACAFCQLSATSV